MADRGESPTFDTKLPESFTFIFHPYGRYTLTNLRLIPYGVSQAPGLEGACVAGTTRSYLAGHTSDRSAVGEKFVVWGVTVAELAAGEATRASCG